MYTQDEIKLMIFNNQEKTLRCVLLEIDEISKIKHINNFEKLIEIEQV